jgi:hypothetical protein
MKVLLAAEAVEQTALLAEMVAQLAAAVEHKLLEDHLFRKQVLLCKADLLEVKATAAVLAAAAGDISVVEQDQTLIQVLLVVAARAISM